MKAQVKTIEGSVARDIELPALFSEEYRPDLIRKAVLALQSSRRQPHGTYPYAGICSSAVGWGSGRGASHVPRIKNGSRAAKVPQAKGGREAHPPVVAKVLLKQINQKEKQKAFRSAVAASVREDLVRGRGHIFDSAVPVVFEDKFECTAVQPNLGPTTFPYPIYCSAGNQIQGRIGGTAGKTINVSLLVATGL
jgi:large subunit ribosomal protein L4e